MTAPVDGGALTSSEQDAFDYLRAAMDQHPGIALVRSALDGRPCAVVATVEQRDDDEFVVTPLAVLVDEALMARLTDPARLVEEQDRVRTLYEVYRVGDPDPTPTPVGEDPDTPCGEVDTRNAEFPYRCTWQAGHDHPQHVAAAYSPEMGGGVVVAVWPK